MTAFGVDLGMSAKQEKVPVIKLVTDILKQCTDPQCLHLMTSEQIAKSIKVPKPEVDQILTTLQSKGSIRRYTLPRSRRAYWGVL